MSADAVAFFRTRFRAAGSAERAAREKAYMKSALRFHGVDATTVRLACRELVAAQQPDAAAVRTAVEIALARGDRAFIVHAVGDAHEALLSALSDHGLTIGRDVSVISAAAAFDTTALSTAVDTIPLVPSRSCDLAVEIALRHLEEKNVAPQIHLIPPEYRSTGSVRARTD